MTRRSFATLGGLALTSPADGAPAARKTTHYVLQTYYLRHGTQLARLNDYLSRAWLPALRRAHDGPVLCLEALVAPHLPQFVVLTGYRSLEQAGAVAATLRADRAHAEAFRAWEAGGEAPHEKATHTLLEATAYSPEVIAPAEPPATPRVFELRVYHSPTERQLEALHERFAGPEIRIFHRVGVHPILYTSTLYGTDMPNLTYVTPFDSLAAREKAWTAFSNDPEWIRVRQESTDRHGQIASINQISLFRAAAYSPVR